MSRKIASLYAEIGADAAKLKAALADAGNRVKKFGGDAQGWLKKTFNFKDMASGVGEAVEKLTGLSVAQLTATGAIAAAAGYIRSSIVEYSAYAEQVWKVANATGMATEETSKLIQLADDMRVPIEALQTGMKIALQNGFVPTVENMAKLADELRGISDPAERAAKLSKIFGRSWQEILPMLTQGGQAIRDNAAAIESSLIVTDQAAKQNLEYVKTMDALGDSWTGVKYKLAETFLPALTETLKTITRNDEVTERYGNKLAGLGGYAGVVAEQMDKATIALDKANGQLRIMPDRMDAVNNPGLEPAVQSAEKLVEPLSRVEKLMLAAKEHGGGLQLILDQINGRVIRFSIVYDEQGNISGQGSKKPSKRDMGSVERAFGGPTAAGMRITDFRNTYGQRETWIPGNGYVLTEAQARRALAEGGGGANVTINITGNVSSRADAEHLARRVGEQLRRRL